MTGPLLDTKTRVPGPRTGGLVRPRLAERLARGTGSALTLVSAPAGFGKTTVLTQWLAGAPGPAVAWVSLDEGDDEPTRFWTYVVTALGTAVDGVGSGVLPLLE